MIASTETKRCGRCGTDKSLDDFGTNINGKQGKDYHCKICRRRYHKDCQRKLRQKVIDAYGGCCSCCGETEIYFLAIDHIFGNAKEDPLRRNNDGGYNFYLQLRKHGYPQGKYRVLCHNCNMGRQCNDGVCPHKSTIERDANAVWASQHERQKRERRYKNKLYLNN
jgi:hypothetical protein